MCLYQSPPAHLLQPLRTLLAVRCRQLAGRAGVKSEQREQCRKSPVAAVQTEEQVVQLDADASRAVLALVAQSEEDVRLAAVSDEEGSQWCTREYFMCLLHAHGPPVVTTVLELLVSAFHQFVLCFAAEWTEVCGKIVSSMHCLAPGL